MLSALNTKNKPDNSELKAEDTFSQFGVTGRNQDVQLRQLETSHADIKGFRITVAL